VRGGESQTTREFNKMQKYDKALPNNQHVFNGTCVDQDDDLGFIFHGNNHRSDALKSTSPKSIKSKGIPGIKKCELYNKWRPLMPDKTTADIMCPHPGDEALKGAKANRTEKKELKFKKIAKRKKSAKARAEG
jgi:hypothetical protein